MEGAGIRYLLQSAVKNVFVFQRPGAFPLVKRIGMRFQGVAKGKLQGAERRKRNFGGYRSIRRSIIFAKSWKSVRTDLAKM